MSSWRSRCILGFFLLLLLPVCLNAATVSGTVKDSTGAVVVGAQIEIRGSNLAQPLIVNSDASGHFAIPDLKPGSYILRVTSGGFEPLERGIDLVDVNVNFEINLALPVAKEQITVPGNNDKFANSDAVYRKLRKIGLGAAFSVEGFTFKCDVATFEMKRGTLTLLEPVNGIVTGAVFVGAGHFTLKPVTRLAQTEIHRRLKTDQIDEDFTDVVFRYTGPPGKMLLAAITTSTATSEDSAKVLEHWRESMRQRREVPLGFSESLLHGDSMENVDAEVLASLYNPNRPGFFDAYMRGTKHKDLRFRFHPRGGAMPELDSPEEIALINYDPEGMDDGIWYLDHLAQEYTKGTASSDEERRYLEARKFKIETVIGKNDHLASIATVTFEPLIAGERVVKFRLLPNLRVTRVSDQAGKDLYFLQENRKQDGSFYVILADAIDAGKECSVTIEYGGDKVLLNAGNGSYYVHARESWYPNLNGFNERALYDLTFKIPKKYKLISLGMLEREWMEGDFAASHWTTAKPIAVAGFNFGQYQKVDIADNKDGYQIEGYYLPELPDRLNAFKSSALSGMAPRSMTQYALQETRAELQLCDYFFGKSGFNHIYITEQPDFNYGQSWPNLVYLPISA
ncbi:MAG: hypothetical protein DMG92_09460 [Acidobacteria bacterium]|nr:MAG: hypothetical protein DMG92_09460 [Acidobacteriota bacterium]